MYKAFFFIKKKWMGTKVLSAFVPFVHHALVYMNSLSMLIKQCPMLIKQTVGIQSLAIKRL